MVEAKGAITPTLIGHNQKDEHEWKMVAFAELYAKDPGLFSKVVDYYFEMDPWKSCALLSETQKKGLLM